MRTLLNLSFAAVLTACAVTAKTADCGALGLCLSNGNIAVLADNVIADPILTTAQEGAVSFKRYFASGVPPTAIVPGGEITPEMQKEINAAGYVLSLPWISPADKLLLSQSNVRRQVLEQTQGMSLEQQEAIIKSALAQSDIDERNLSNMDEIEQGALTHELGHLWFMSTYKPLGEAVEGGQHGYGGWAPDWLDETAAILMENDALAALRRETFVTMPVEDFYPLQAFLTMEHPALKSAQKLKKTFGDKVDSGGSRAIVLSGEEAEAFLKSSGKSNPANFYTQVRGFADYIIEATGDEQVFATLAHHFSQGKSFENWLEKTDGLPNDMMNLNKVWEAHLAKR